ncbi:HPP family protein [Halogeometricum borinquense]|uniref:HPP family protein n=1 Tax=Halogeometricum borinquense TaxID=60847 RepID=A0A6C0UK24_9EURY|nr:HPP family protein [Halogeometricum borinquense]QIB74671.1 HPP family protein [Halogeometricum borinquense]QIQ76376.1 HPP family protein [Halogeometricum borinquense]
MTRSVAVGIRATLLLTLSAATAWLAGVPALFPSLGPSAFVLAVRESGPTPRTVLGGHAVGVACGFFTYLAVSTFLSVPTTPLDFHPPWLVLSGVVAVGLTSTGMLAFDAVHPPACATTLIVALGLMSTPAEVALVLPSVASLLVVDRFTA